MNILEYEKVKELLDKLDLSLNELKEELYSSTITIFQNIRLDQAKAAIAELKRILVD